MGIRRIDSRFESSIRAGVMPARSIGKEDGVFKVQVRDMIGKEDWSGSYVYGGRQERLLITMYPFMAMVGYAYLLYTSRSLFLAVVLIPGSD